MPVQIGGAIAVDKRGIITAAVSFVDTATVLVPDADDRLHLVGPTQYLGGSYYGDGTLEQIGNAKVSDDTTIDVSTYDWDGIDANPSATLIEEGTVFTINSQELERKNKDGYGGTIFMEAAKLEVNITEPRADGTLSILPWSLDAAGKIDMKGGKKGGDINFIRLGDGSPMTVSGEIRASAPTNYIEPDVTFRSTADVNVSSNQANLYLAGLITYLGGSFDGPGTLHQIGDAVVDGNITIDVNTYDWDGSEASPSITTVEANGRLELAVASIDDVPGDQFGGVINLMTNSRLAVQPGAPSGQALEWTIGPGAELHMQPQARILDHVDGGGSAGPSPIIVEGSIFAAGQNRIAPPVTFQQGATVSVNDVSGEGVSFFGPVVYQAGPTSSFTGPGMILHAGDVEVRAITQIDVGRIDLDGRLGDTTIDLYSRLILNVQSIESGFLSGGLNENQTDNIYNGTMRAHGALHKRLVVNTPDPWEMAGIIRVDPDGDSSDVFGPIYSLKVMGAPVLIIGTVDVGINSTVEFDTAFNAVGPAAFPGAGTVVISNQFSPGASPGSVRFGGDVRFGPSAHLLIEFSGGGHDSFEVLGTVELDGVLRIAMLDDYRPTELDTFTILTAGDIQGQFANALGEWRTRYGTFDVSYSGGGIVLSNFIPEPAGVLPMAFCLVAMVGRRYRD